jgi:hypothetical protein
MGQGLYFYDTRAKKHELSELMPGLAVKREFLGANSKTYVLLEWSNLGHGVWDQGYAVFHLVPKSAGRPFRVSRLLTVNEDPLHGLCGEQVGDEKSWIQEQGKAETIEGVSVEGEGTAKVSVTFDIRAQNCSDRSESKFSRKFGLKDGNFQELR